MSARLLAASVALAALAAVPGVAHAQNQLGANQSLRDNQQIRSNNGQTHLIMQTDCNLVLYRGARALWSSRTNGRGDGCYAIMQSDGNLVVYDAAGTALWASNTSGRSNAALQLEDDGNMAIYSGGRAVWQTNTAPPPPATLPERPRPPGGGDGWTGGGGGSWGGASRPWEGADQMRPGDELSGSREESLESPRGSYRLTMRQSCELEVTQGSGWSGRQVWRAGTQYAGRNCRLVLRNSGDLVVIADGRAIWGTNTSGRNAIAFVDRDGNLIVYDRDRNRELFNSRRDYGRRY